MIIALTFEFRRARTPAMNPPSQCPFCGSSAVLNGSIYSKGHGFHPDGTRTGLVLSLRSFAAFHFGPAAQFCPECCMVWSQADVRDVEKFMHKFAGEELKHQLAQVQIGTKARSAVS